MTRKEPAPHEVLRGDRAKDDPWIRAFLEEAPYGFLATVHEGRPFLNMNLFVYDAEVHAVYLHTARAGRTRGNVEGHGNDGTAPEAGGAPATLGVAGMGRILPADEALEFSVEYAGVVCFGAVRVVEDDEEKERGLRLLLEKYAPHLRPGRDYRAITPEELRRTTVFRLDVDAWSGKQKAAEPEFPGAFERPGLPIPFEPERGEREAPGSGP